jgi:hypothetical protein
MEFDGLVVINRTLYGNNTIEGNTVIDVFVAIGTTGAERPSRVFDVYDAELPSNMILLLRCKGRPLHISPIAEHTQKHGPPRISRISETGSVFKEDLTALHRLPGISPKNQHPRQKEPKR